MNKKLLTIGFMLLGVTVANAQYPLKTIADIQTVSPQDLAAGIDESPLFQDTVRIRGVVIMDAGLSQVSTTVAGKQVWIQTNGGSVFAGIDVYQDNPAGNDDGGTGILALVAGDSVEITGWVDEFQGETEFRPVTNPAIPIQLLGSGITVTSKLITVAELNDPNRQNILTTGEQYEGMYVQFQNLTVQSVDYFSNGTRVSFNVIDANGNKMNVSDRFPALRMAAMGGSFVPPNVGDVITSIKGVLLHSKNNRGYELHPFSGSDIVFGPTAPAISNIRRTPAIPTSSQSVTVKATIRDVDGVSEAKLFYAIGASATNFDSVAMTGNVDTFSAVISAQANGSIVKFFIRAKDNTGLTSRIPNYPASDPIAYIVKDGALEITDLQYTPFKSGNSIFTDQIVTVTGVVTSSSSDLGSVFIQQENQLAWAGLMCLGNSSLSTLTLGQKVTVTGTVKESFGHTQLESISTVSLAGTGTITPLVLVADSFRSNPISYTGTEPYEGMLVKFAPTAAKLKVIDQNADDPSQFAEYRVGMDTLDEANGCRVLVGRNTSTVFSSKNVSYVNDPQWVPNVGIPQIIVQKGDSMTSLTGIMYYGFSNFKLLPRNNADFVGYEGGVGVGIGSSRSNKGNVIAYPNPADERISFDYILPENAKDLSLKIYDLMGREITAEKISDVSGTMTLNTTDFVQGTYIYSIVSEVTGTVNTGRFMIVK
jgi:hypothetical protein